jgi:hypothetical protein
VTESSGHLLIRVSQAEEHPGFTDALLDILHAEQEAPVRLSGEEALDSIEPRSMGLTRDCSRRLPQEPCHKRMVTERGCSTQQTNTRR